MDTITPDPITTSFSSKINTCSPDNDSPALSFLPSFPSLSLSSSAATCGHTAHTHLPTPPPPPSSSSSSSIFTSTSNTTSTFHSQLGISDSEMIALQSVTYTSLKDVLPQSPPPPRATSPTAHNSDELAIRNPLVKHAALAYLQPMSTPPEVGDEGLFGKLKKSCRCQCDCFSWLNDVVLRSFRDLLREFGVVCDRDDIQKVD